MSEARVAGSAARRSSPVKFLAVTVQLALAVLVMILFEIEADRGFVRLASVILGGFVVHAWLPHRFRQPFFLLLFAIAGVVVLGSLNAALVVGVGLVLIGLCHLPVPFWLRVALVVAAGVVLALFRTEWVSVPQAPVVLPVLASIFMFRLMIYLYDLRHEKKKATVWERLSYFFLLPNWCFPLFPVVDYGTYRRTYYDSDPDDIYQKGVHWVFRGITHLLLYRVVYHYLLPAPTEVEGLAQVVQYMVATYALYLRISGQFHLIVGILCLFGFNLPETNHLYFLASGFNDFWRRINIYWRDFMMKIFFYPTLTRLRRWGIVRSLIVATPLVFLATFLLHGYQWFWLRGAFTVTVTDAIFWGGLGVLVTVNAIVEARRPQTRRLKAPAWSFRDAVVLSLKTVGTFVFLCFLWNLWSAGSVDDWLALLSRAGSSTPSAYGIALLAVAGLVVVGVGIQWVRAHGPKLPAPSFSRSAAISTAALLVLGAVGLPAVQIRLGVPAFGFLSSIQRERLNPYDAEQAERGYYEGLLQPRFGSAVWESRVNMPKVWVPIMLSEAIRQRPDLLGYELKPNWVGQHKGEILRTNEWGMADRSYPRRPEPGTFRIALLGSSYAMGPGVERDETFEAIVERRLNEDLAGKVHDRFEILNFSVGGYSVVHYVEQLEQVFDFEPDLILLVAHSTEASRLRTHFSKIVEDDLFVPYPVLRAVFAQTGAERGMVRAELDRRFNPYAGWVIQWAYNRIAASCRERGIPVVWTFIPTTEEVLPMYRGQLLALQRFASEAGFFVWPLGDPYGDHDRRTLRLAPWDHHPNALGHRLIADRLYEAFRENEDLLQRGKTEVAGSASRK